MGRILVGLGWLIGLGVFVLTVIGVAGTFGLGWALVAFFFPPADLIFAWLVSPLLGIGSLLAIGLVLSAGAVDAYGEQRRSGDHGN